MNRTVTLPANGLSWPVRAPHDDVSLHAAWDGTADGTYVGLGTFLDAGCTTHADFLALDDYRELGEGQGMRWSGADWDTVGALGSTPRTGSLLMAVNAAGTVAVGVSANPDPVGPEPETFGIRSRAPFGLDPAQGDPDMETLEPLDGARYSQARDVDDSGNAIGESATTHPVDFSRLRACLWPHDSETPVPLPALPGTQALASQATAIAADGSRVAGWSQFLESDPLTGQVRQNATSPKAAQPSSIKL